MIPSMLVRTFTDSIRSMLQGLGYMKMLGFLYFLNIFVFTGYSYYLIVVKETGEYGYSGAVLLYELTGLLICAGFWVFVINKKYKNFQNKTFDNICWYALEAAKTVSMCYYNWISYDFVLFIITYTHNDYQVAAFSLLNSVPTILTGLASSFMMQSRN